MKIAEYRHTHRLTLKGFADICGIGTSTVHRLERGAGTPTYDNLTKIIAATGGAVGIADFAPGDAPTPR